MGSEFIALFFGAAVIGIFILIAIFVIGILKWLLQGYFLYKVAEVKNYHLPWLGFVPFGTFYLGGQAYDGNILKKKSFDPKQIGLVFAIAGIIVYFLGLSIGDIVISYLLMESIAFIGIFTAYAKQPIIGVLLALLNIVTAGIAAIVILFLYSRKLQKEHDGSQLFNEEDIASASGFDNPARNAHPNDPNLNRDI